MLNEVIANYDELIREMPSQCHTEKWRKKRQLNDTILRSFETEARYHRMRAKSGVESSLTTKHQAELKIAINKRRELYRARKEMLGQKKVDEMPPPPIPERD